MDRVANLGQLLGDHPRLLHMVIILFDHRRNIIHIPLTLAQTPLHLGGLDDLIDNFHLLMSISYLRRATERDVVWAWRGRLEADLLGICDWGGLAHRWVILRLISHLNDVEGLQRRGCGGGLEVSRGSSLTDGTDRLCGFCVLFE